MTDGTNILHLVRRGWYLYAAAFLLSAAVIYTSGFASRVYTGEVYVSFDPPVEATLSEEWVDHTETLINYSRVIDSTYAAVHSTVDLSSPKATLFGNGVREGTSVELLTSGNQWVKQLDRPVIVVNVSSSSDDRTQALLRDTAQLIADLSDDIQSDLGIPSDQRIVTSWNEQEFAVGSFGRTRQGTVKGAVALALATSVFATLAAFLIDRRGTRHSGRGVPSPLRGREPAQPPQLDGNEPVVVKR